MPYNADRGVIAVQHTDCSQSAATPWLTSTLPPARTLPPRRRRRLASSFWALTLGSIGVVYGDIGTSPLYALREAVLAAVGAGGAPTRDGGARHAVADHLGADRRRHR